MNRPAFNISYTDQITGYPTTAVYLLVLEGACQDRGTSFPATVYKYPAFGETLLETGTILPTTGTRLSATGETLPGSGEMLPGFGAVLQLSGELLK